MNPPFLWLECGGTRCQGFVLEDREAPVTFEIHPGFNARQCSLADLEILSQEVKKKIKAFRPFGVLFYAAGTDVSNAPAIRDFWTRMWPGARVAVGSDLAALGLATGGAALVGLLGTGASAGYWDGHQIVATGPSLGWIAGDEGSGAWIGKNLIRARLYDLMPEEWRPAFDGFAGASSRAEYLSILYGKEGSRQTAGLARWLDIKNVRRHPWTQNLLREGFESFLRFQILPLFQKFPTKQIWIGGSIAWHFCRELKEIAKAFELPAVKVEKSATQCLLTRRPEHIQRILEAFFYG
ncbi:MAG: hypothetical protein NZM15_00945 [Flavobacteriales bacterium]|nr:hypothetical protein [Flavobacteriales bacterium]MDW8431249.1 hypothetical protein [Flavobacteriales bacterium]